MATRSLIERLIEMGLNRYGAGELEEALLLWEEALAIDADNAQANSYVDYVRQHYDLLTSAEPAVEDAPDAPFPIDEEPQYKIEGQLAEPPPIEAAPVADEVDLGWEIQGTHDAGARHAEPLDAEPAPPAAEGAPPERLEIELEADEPPLAEVNFEDATREYEPGAHRRHEPPATAPVAAAGDPPPPATGEAAATSDETAVPAAPDELDDGTAGPTVGFFRDDEGTAGPTVAFFRGDEGTAGPTVAFFRGDELTGGPTQGFFRGDDATVGFGGEDGDGAAQRVEDALADEASSGFEPEATPGLSTQETQVRKRDFGFVQAVVVAPATVPEPPAPSSLAAGTAAEGDVGELEMTLEGAAYSAAGPPGEDELDDPIESMPTPVPGQIAQTSASTRELPSLDAPIRLPEPMLSAPTRELGLRPGGRPHSQTDDDAPTGQTDVRAIRLAAAREDGTFGRQISETTATDVVVAFDPLVAASAQIFDEIEEDVPATETTDDRTRRRISALLVKATEWSEAGDSDRCAVAVDLALSEEPNSAVAQKLITRHRDTIMNLLQGYLGDLERTPQVAKPLHELGSAQISPRVAFLLSRIDGMLTLEELLDVSGMPRLEALRHLCQLFLRGILR